MEVVDEADENLPEPRVGGPRTGRGQHHARLFYPARHRETAKSLAVPAALIGFINLPFDFAHPTGFAAWTMFSLEYFEGHPAVPDGTPGVDLLLYDDSQAAWEVMQRGGLDDETRRRMKRLIDNAATNKVISSLSAASTNLRTQGSALGSNLSIVQIRQDFSKNLINVLQTGSSNLTLADTNEEAANSQAPAI